MEMHLSLHEYKKHKHARHFPRNTWRFWSLAMLLEMMGHPLSAAEGKPGSPAPNSITNINVPAPYSSCNFKAMLVSLTACSTLQGKTECRNYPYCLLFNWHLHYPRSLNVFSISVPVLEVNGRVSPSHAPGLAVLKEAPTSQHLMRNVIPSLETAAMS